MQAQPIIDILLGTFNGEQYIKEQILSILDQSYKTWRLIIRDDGSNDNTQDIIRDYAKRYPDRIIHIENNGRRLGSCQNYASLLEYSSSDYVMFCDQDDVWLPEKVEVTFEKIREMEDQYGSDLPLMVHTDLRVVDDRLKTLHASFWKYQNLSPEKRSLNRVLVQNIVTGCTILINKTLRDISGTIPSGAIVHDWWMALAASAFGQIGMIRDQTVLYRQHSANHKGAQKWGWGHFFGKGINYHVIRESLRYTRAQAASFLETYRSNLERQKLMVVETYATLDERNFLSRRVITIKKKYFKMGLLRNVGLLIAI